jgi:hypothetical protein
LRFSRRWLWRLPSSGKLHTASDVPSLLKPMTLIMEAVCSTEISILTRATQSNIPKDRIRVECLNCVAADYIFIYLLLFLNSFSIHYLCVFGKSKLFTFSVMLVFIYNLVLTLIFPFPLILVTTTRLSVEKYFVCWNIFVVNLQATFTEFMKRLRVQKGTLWTPFLTQTEILSKKSFFQYYSVVFVKTDVSEESIVTINMCVSVTSYC